MTPTLTKLLFVEVSGGDWDPPCANVKQNQKKKIGLTVWYITTFYHSNTKDVV